MMASLKDRWSALPDRTRRLLMAGTPVIVVALLYTVAWSPLQRNLSRLRTEVPRTTEQLQWMRTQVPTVKVLRAKTMNANGPLLPNIEQSATAQGIRSYLTKIEADGSQGARVTADSAPFNTLMTWISDLQNNYGAIVEEATIDAHATPGVVNARLRLRPAGT